MKKNLLIMMMMVLCAGFVSAQTINTVRGFVPGGSTNSASGTYAAFGQPFATIANNHGHEVSVGLAQMQLVTDSITDVVTCGQGYHKHGFDLTEEELQELLVQCENEGQRGYLRSQKPNVAVQDYYYDSLVVIDLYVCPCTTTVENEEYEVIALNGECWFKENMRNNFEGSMLYTSELNSVDPADPEQLKTFGRLYTYEATISGAEVCEDGEIQGICPVKWHLPTVDEVDPLFTLPAENLRVDGHWIVDGNNNMTEFSAQPAGYYNSISQRFEGMLTETDFWMVDCDNLNPEDNQLPVLQLIYSCNTPLKPNRPKEDAISVRCVYNIVKHLEDCDPNLNPEPQPEPPTTSCAIMGTPVVNPTDYSFSAPMAELNSNTAVALIFNATYTYQTTATQVGYETYTETVKDTVRTFPDNALTATYPGSTTYSADNLTSLICTYTILDGTETCASDRVIIINENPTPECPEFGSVHVNSDYLVMGTVANYQANDEVTYTAKVNFTDQTYQNYTNQPVTSIDDEGNFIIEIPLYSVANADAVFSDFYGEVFVTRANTDCADTAEFDSDANGCPSMDTGGQQFVNGVFSMSIWDYDPNYFEDVQVSFTYITEDGEQDPVSATPSFNPGEETNEVIMSATSPFTSITPEMQKVMVYVNFVFKDEYSSCAADLDFLNFSWECYPRCEYQNLAKVTDAGVHVDASNKISFELENYTDADVLRFDGTVYVTDGGVQQAIPVQSPTTGIYVLHTPNTNVWGYEYTPISSTATVDSMKGYVRLNPDDICATSAPFNTSSYNAVTPQEPTTGYTCPESLGSITAPSTTMEYDYYCTINGDAAYIQEIAVTYLYYVPGNTNPAFSLPASNVNVQSGEITFSNPTEDAPQGHSFNNVNHILIQVHVTPVESCGSTPLDQTLNIYMN